MSTRLVFRLFSNRQKIFEEYREFTDEQLDGALSEFIDRHIKLIADVPSMVEVEFLDIQDINQRFLRIGTDPRDMVRPLKIDLSGCDQ